MQNTPDVIKTENDDFSEQGALFQKNAKAAQIIIFVNGLLLTMVVFAFLSVFTQEIIENEQRYIADYSMQSFINTTERMGAVVGGASLMAERHLDFTSLERDFRKFEIEGDTFYGFILARQGAAGIWERKIISFESDNPDIQKIFNALGKDNAILEAIQKHVKDKKVDLGKIFYMRHKNTVFPELKEDFHLLIRKSGPADQPIMVVGFISPYETFYKPFMGSSKYLSKVMFSEQGAELGPMLLKIGQNQEPMNESEKKDYSRQFRIDMWQTSMDVILEFNRENKLYFFQNIPLYFGIIGAFLTIIATFYVQNNRLQSNKLSEMNAELEKKNLALQKEVQERERLNTALRLSEKENRAIIDAVTDIIFETNIEGEIMFISASWKKVTGFDNDKFIGQELFSLLHPQDQKQQHRDFEMLIKGQKQAYRSFARIRTSDGTFRAVEIAMSMIRQDQNKNLRVVGTFTDVEERRRAERALAEAEKKYRTIVENAAGGIYQLTPEGIYLSANPSMARILGYESPEKLLREVRNAYDSVYESEKERMEVFSALSDNVDFYNHETQMIRKDGSKLWVSENIRAVKDDAGNILYFEGSVEDIEQRKAFEIGLMDAKMNSDLANRAKSEFLANMSHELRTPLNSIIGFSEIMKNEVFGKIEQPSYLEYAKHINDSGQSLLRVINEILDISRIEAGDRILNESIVNVEQIASDCMDLLASKIENNKMNVINNLEGMPRVIAEELAIKQILMNLLSNAIKFTPGGGRITLAYEVNPHGELHVSVTDTGIGLDDQEIEKALSPFGQVDSTLNRTGSGTGLGLTLVTSLIKLHGGRFDLFSQKGIGTTATIIFPVDRISLTQPEEEMLKAGLSGNIEEQDYDFDEGEA
jgi:PAS domain S-box-containing protein